MSPMLLKPSLSSPIVDDKTQCPESYEKSSMDGEEHTESQPPKSMSFFDRLYQLICRLTGTRGSGDYNNNDYEYDGAPTQDDMAEFAEIYPPHWIQQSRRARVLKWLKWLILCLPILVLCLFGVLHILMVLFGGKHFFWDVQEYERYLPNWSKIDDTGKSLSPYPTDFTRGIPPIPCHSHNDYWRGRPLFDAIRWGCTSVEADVWHFDGKDELYIGHNTASLTPERTFRSLYVYPILDVLNSMNPNDSLSEQTSNGVFDMNPEQTLVLLVDFKTNGRDLYPYVLEQLEPLRQKDYLSYWDGHNFISRQVTVVGTGNTPFDLVVNDRSYRDIFFDAPLDELWADPLTELETRNDIRAASPGQGQGQTGTDDVNSPDAFDTTNSYFASVSFKKSIGFPWKGRLTERQLNLLRGQIRGAKRRGLIARYWDTPDWPTSLRNHIWQTLIEEGADMLNVDDLRSAAALDWGAPVRHSWFDT